MIEGVEEVTAHPEPDTLGETEVFESADVLIPGTRAEHIVARVPAQVVGNEYGSSGSVRKRLRQVVVETGAERVNVPRASIDWNQALKRRSVRAARLSRIEIAGEPKHLF